jgi:hypothetical protein
MLLMYQYQHLFLIFRSGRIFNVASDLTKQSIPGTQYLGFIFHLGSSKDLINFVFAVASGWKYVLTYPHCESLKYDNQLSIKNCFYVNTVHID